MSACSVAGLNGDKRWPAGSVAGHMSRILISFVSGTSLKRLLFRSPFGHFTQFILKPIFFSVEISPGELTVSLKRPFVHLNAIQRSSRR